MRPWQSNVVDEVVVVFGAVIADDVVAESFGTH
jgi:hypothetical protein